MSKLILFVSIISIFTIAAVLLTLGVWNGLQYSESLVLEQDIRDTCVSPLCSPPVTFTEKYQLDLIVYTISGAALCGGGIVLFLKFNREKGLNVANDSQPNL